MGMDYTLIAGLALYFITVKAMASANLKPPNATLIVALGYFAVSTITKAIMLSGYDDAPLWQLVSWVPLSTLCLQLVIGFIAFKKLEDSDDSYGAWLFWGILGSVGIFFIAPFIATSVFGRF